MTLQPWKRVGPTNVRKVGYLTITDKHFVQPSGLEVEWTIMNDDAWAGACAIVITTEGKVVLARQFRAGPERIMDELPGGILDPGETPEQCVVREVAEEVGYKPGKIEYLGVNYYSAAVNGKRHSFLFTDCIPTTEGAQPTPDEDIELRFVTIDELLAIAKRGLMTDPGGVLMAYDKLMELKESNDGKSN